MPDIGVYHPVIVHFAVALLIAGVLFRWVSLSGRAAFTGPAAAASVPTSRSTEAAAVHSGLDAHGPVERIPGVRQAVVDHEDAGIWARNVFLIVAALELLALATRRRHLNVARGALWGSAIVSVFGVAAVYKAGNRGADLVYRYAGGVGMRYNDTTDVNRLYLAALYQKAQQARAKHDSALAAELFGELARQYPNDTTVRFLHIESLIRDQRDARGALRALAGLNVPPGDRRLRLRHGFLRVDAFVAAGRTDSARATLEQLARDFPDVPRIQERMRTLNGQ